MRTAGILFPIFSIPSKYGVGTFSEEAFRFVDFLEKSGQGYWQVLPMGPTGYGNSPYQPLSAFAGNPYFISFEKLIKDGYLTYDECNGVDFGQDLEKVDYGKLYENRIGVLKKAYVRFVEKKSKDKELAKKYSEYLKAQNYWIRDYALYNTIKNSVEECKAWTDWDVKYKKRDTSALEKIEKEYAQEMDYLYFTQYIFDEQWAELKEYANEHKVKIIGDIPFYVAIDSVDVWAHPEVFQLDKDLAPKVVAGCPPDAFSATGQMWGNPIYDWKETAKNDYDWWMRRLARNLELYDVIRFDHFHGFAQYYAVPADAKDASKGKMEKGPGMSLFNVIFDKLGDVQMIAEDLGEVTKENEALLKNTGIPGMAVLQYAFTSWDSKYVTHRHEKNQVVYTGTHDNTPTRAWIEEIGEGDRGFARRYINSRNSDYGAFVWDFIREAYHSAADTCIIPLTDYLVKGKEARLNCPGTMDGNWEWRLLPNFLSEELANSIREMSETYGRIPQ